MDPRKRLSYHLLSPGRRRHLVETLESRWVLAGAAFDMDLLLRETPSGDRIELVDASSSVLLVEADGSATQLVIDGSAGHDRLHIEPEVLAWTGLEIRFAGGEGRDLLHVDGGTAPLTWTIGCS